MGQRVCVRECDRKENRGRMPGGTSRRSPPPRPHRPDPQLPWLLTRGPCLLCSGLSPQEPGLAQDWNAAEGDEESEDSPVSWWSPPLPQTPADLSGWSLPFPRPLGGASPKQCPWETGQSLWSSDLEWRVAM